jgi:cyclin H
MFHDSTQRKHWLFDNPQDIRRKRENLNRTYRDKAREVLPAITEYLSVEEECKLVNEYVRKLLELCSSFQPPVPHSTIATAVHYLKRFYLLRSVMDYHPRDIYMCCTYLAFKVDEYNLDADQFVQVLPSEDRKKTGDLVLHLEPTIMLQLSFQMIIHSPFRSLEGLLVGLKLKCPKIDSLDRLKKVANGFLMHHFYSDVCFLYPPSQIALAALVHSANHSKIDVDNYLEEISSSEEYAKEGVSLMQRLRDIEKMVVSAVGTRQEEVSRIEAKLKECRNEDNNPNNPRFWKKKKKDKEPPQGSNSSSSSKRRKVDEEEEEAEEEGVL